jgi:tRNA (guanine-N7-)-methyltransferase
MSDYRSIASHIFIPYDHRSRPIDWPQEFGNNKPLQVEIGFGQGEYLLACAGKNSDRNYVGIELDWGRIQRCFKKAARMPNGQRSIIENQLRVLQIDAWVILERFFRQKTIAQAVCLFPCPWPKDRHEKHRLFSHDFLRLLNSRLDDNGCLQCVTDYQPYADWILEQSKGAGFLVEEKTTPARFGTKFEHKWQSGGQMDFYEILFKKQHHMDMPLKEDVELKAFYHKEFYPEKFEINEDVSEGIAVVPKEWMFDPLQQKGLVRLIVSEEHLTQHVWIVIIKTQKGWCVLRAEGQNALPTSGVARAIELVSKAVEFTSKNK